MDGHSYIKFIFIFYYYPYYVAKKSGKSTITVLKKPTRFTSYFHSFHFRILSNVQGYGVESKKGSNGKLAHYVRSTISAHDQG